jgi:hypothetical protein
MCDDTTPESAKGAVQPLRDRHPERRGGQPICEATQPPGPSFDARRNRVNAPEDDAVDGQVPGANQLDDGIDLFGPMHVMQPEAAIDGLGAVAEGNV